MIYVSRCYFEACISYCVAVYTKSVTGQKVLFNPELSQLENTCYKHVYAQGLDVLIRPVTFIQITWLV
jgi:hypothetical protein